VVLMGTSNTKATTCRERSLKRARLARCETVFPLLAPAAVQADFLDRGLPRVARFPTVRKRPNTAFTTPLSHDYRASREKGLSDQLQ